MTFIKTCTLPQPSISKIQGHTHSASTQKRKYSEDSLSVALPPPSNQLASNSRSRTRPNPISSTNAVTKTEINIKNHSSHTIHETNRDSGETQQSSLSGRSRCISSDESIARWVFNRASIAPCFVRDVFEMQDGNLGEFNHIIVVAVPLHGVVLPITMPLSIIIYASHHRSNFIFVLEQDYFWLGRVPCRTVRVVGMVVGVDEFDEMARYKRASLSLSSLSHSLCC